jgi:hypothetical protein
VSKSPPPAIKSAKRLSTACQATGVKIAAATHKVGHTELGGSWQLDAAPATLQHALTIPQWQGVLEPDPQGPVIGGLTAEDNSTFDSNTPVYLDGTEDYAYVTGAVQNSYLTIAQTSGTVNGSLTFDTSSITFEDGDDGEDGNPTIDPSYSVEGVAVVAGTSSDYEDLRQDGSFQAGDKIFLMSENLGQTSFTEIGTVNSLLTSDSDLKITFTRENEFLDGVNSDAPGDIGWVLQFLNYSAPTSGERSFSITVNNDADTVSQAVTVTQTGNDLARVLGFKL